MNKKFITPKLTILPFHYDFTHNWENEKFIYLLSFNFSTQSWKNTVHDLFDIINNYFLPQFGKKDLTPLSENRVGGGNIWYKSRWADNCS